MKTITLDARMALSDENFKWFKEFYLIWTRRGYKINLKWR